MAEDARLHPLLLRFTSPQREAAFQADYVKRSLRLVRLSLLLGAGQYALFGLLDTWMVPHSVLQIRLIRFTVSTLILLFFGLTYTRLFERHMQPLLSLVPLIGGIGVAGMTSIAQGSDGYAHYYVGLMLILFYVHVLLRLRFVYAAIVSWLIIGIHLALAVRLTPLPLLINNHFFLVSANISGMVASYALEYYARRVFWQTEALQEKQRLLEAEYARKSQELEETRQFQLAMLPRTLPEHPSVDLAVYMQTATEVGGDYYDFDLADDGTLTVGDATGHGARASAMVTATKILLASLADEGDVAQVLRGAAGPLRRVGLPRLYMALAVGKLRGDLLELAGAGMPPALIYRARTGIVDEVPLKGLPLGTFVDVHYSKTRVLLAPGDAVLLMSDGFPELFNANGDMLGYERAAALLAEVGTRPAEAIVAHFRATAEAWTHGRARHDGPQDDDMTFLVLKMKPVPTPFATPSYLIDATQ